MKCLPFCKPVESCEICGTQLWELMSLLLFCCNSHSCFAVVTCLMEGKNCIYLTKIFLLHIWSKTIFKIACNNIVTKKVLFGLIGRNSEHQKNVVVFRICLKGSMWNSSKTEASQGDNTYYDLFFYSVGLK